ncbi:hypothetical protein [Reyranella sp.]|jgi:hypothetical protein|uniref:hypothetical protein n=1 Tax=Reyranella sp. TaxID=1929291 RepID=UPI003BAB127B
MKTLLLIAAMMFWGGTSGAQRSDVVGGPHGGKLQEVAGVQVELLVGEMEVTVYVYSTDNTPLDVRDFNITVSIVSGRNHELLQLRAEEPFKLTGNGKAFLRPYSAVKLYLTTPTGMTGSVEY